MVPALLSVSLTANAHLLGKGWQYAVYDLGNGRVRKVPRSLASQTLAILVSREAGFSFRTAMQRAAMLNRLAQDSLAALKAHIPSHEYHLLANPYFHGTACYDQDCCYPLGRALSDATPKNARSLIDKYIDTIEQCWRLGFSELSYMFTVNYGLTSTGDMALIDLGEVSFNRCDAEDAINEKRWLKHRSFRKDVKDEELRFYIAEAMDARVNLNALRTLWRQKFVPNPARLDQFERFAQPSHARSIFA